jgi:hypothetical protein
LGGGWAVVAGGWAVVAVGWSVVVGGWAVVGAIVVVVVTTPVKTHFGFLRLVIYVYDMIYTVCDTFY